MLREIRQPLGTSVEAPSFLWTGDYYALTLKLADKYTPERLERACKAALERIPSPRYKNIHLILESGNDKAVAPSNQSSKTTHDESYALVRGASYYGGGSHEK